MPLAESWTLSFGLSKSLGPPVTPLLTLPFGVFPGRPPALVKGNRASGGQALNLLWQFLTLFAGNSFQEKKIRKAAILFCFNPFQNVLFLASVVLGNRSMEEKVIVAVYGLPELYIYMV